MALFRRKRERSDTPLGEGFGELSPTAEDVARKWWETKTGEPLPPEVEEWIRQLTRTEARRLNIASSLLSERDQEQRQSARKLGEVRLENIESSMRRVRIQHGWLTGYNKLRQTLEEHTQLLNEYNKRLAENGGDAESLYRYEAFEPVHEMYLRLVFLRHLSEDNKKRLAEASNAVDEAAQKEKEENRLVALTAKDLEESKRLLASASEKMEQVFRIQGERTILNLDLTSINDFLNTLKERREALEHDNADLSAEMLSVRTELAKAKAERDDMEPHKAMLSQGRHLLLRLDAMCAVKAELDNVTKELDESNEKLREARQALDTVGAACQQTESDIEILKTKLQGHRTSIAIADSYALQERALRQSTLQQMLLCAQSHWEHIKDGYREIDEADMNIISLRHRTESLRLTLDTLNKELQTLRTDCSNRQHTLAISDSQSVMQLRANLKEGTSCAVCGALNHPYHSDTLLEQKKLVSDLRSEYEQLLADLEAKEKQRQDAVHELTEKTAILSLSQAQLARTKERQARLVSEWKIYAGLDTSLAECSPTTNMEARTEMLRQLASNATRNTNEARQELDNYNYHQSRINELTAQLTHKEQEKTATLRQQAQVNTDCQVLARHTAYLTSTKALTQARFTALYEELSKVISLPDWMLQVQTAPEALRQRLSDLVERSEALTQTTQHLTERIEQIQAELNKNNHASSLLNLCTQRLAQDHERREALLSQANQSLADALHGEDEASFHEDALRSLHSAQDALTAQAQSHLNAAMRLAQAQGRQATLQATSQRLAQSLASQRLSLDMWISRHNASASPVQLSDIEQTLTSPTDWNQLRLRLREANLRAAVERELVDYLNGEVLAMQASISRTTTAPHQVTAENLKKQMQELRRQYREAAMQTAISEVELRRHALSQAQLEEETRSLASLSEP